MARPRVLDLMQNYPFWVFDISGGDGNALFSIFDPTLGFSAVTAPEITVEHTEIKPGNWTYKRRVVRAADVGPITFSRGARFFDSDFYNWITNTVRGRQPVRRNLILIHFLGFRAQAQAAAQADPRSGSQAFPDIAVYQSGLRTPGRAWILYDCLPGRYKAGSDFDAASSDVSIAELEVQPESIAEVTIATLLPAATRAATVAEAAVEIVSALQ